MQNDKKMPMTRIQERAPENRWMKDAKVQPGPVGQHGVIDATMLDPNKINPPRPEGLPERGVGRVDVQVPILEKEKEVLEAQKSEALQDARDSKAEADALGEQLQRMRGDLKQSSADNEALKKKIGKLEGDHSEEIVEYSEKLIEYNEKLSDAMQQIEDLRACDFESQLAEAQEQAAMAKQRIEELEAAKPEPEEVEVFPRKITLSEVTNTRKKNDILLVKGTVAMDEGEEDLSVLLRIPYNEVAAVFKGE